MCVYIYVSMYIYICKYVYIYMYTPGGQMTIVSSISMRPHYFSGYPTLCCWFLFCFPSWYYTSHCHCLTQMGWVGNGPLLQPCLHLTCMVIMLQIKMIIIYPYTYTIYIILYIYTLNYDIYIYVLLYVYIYILNMYIYMYIYIYIHL